MKTFNQLSVVACAAFVMVLSAIPAAAQQGQGGRGNFEEFRQRRMTEYRERLEIKGDDEWKAIQPLIEKVSEARREVGLGGGGAFGFGRGGSGGPGGRRAGGDAQANGNNGGNQGGRRGFPGAEPSPEA